MRFSRGEIVPLFVSRAVSLAVLLVVAVFLGSASGCAALSGLGNYEECTEDCVGAGAQTDDGPTTDLTRDSGESVADDANPVGDETPAETGEPNPPDDANVNDASSSSEAESDARETPDTGVVTPFDAGAEAEASSPPPPPTGPTCGPRGTSNRCTSNQVCCANLTGQTNACSSASGCGSTTTLSCATASDCPSSAAICCAAVILTPDAQNDLPPKCAVTSFSASCASACADTPPASCSYLGNVRLCSHDADCQSDLLSNQCWNYNNAPESWCTSQAAGQGGGGVHQP
jgi:hypothetical protein